MILSPDSDRSPIEFQSEDSDQPPRPIPPSSSWRPMPEDSLAKTHLVDSLYHALRSTGYGQLRHIGVDYHDGCIYLRGRVPTDFHKQIAQALAASFPQVQRIENEIEVVSHH